MDREEAKVQNKEKMNSRIETLLKKFELEKCKNFLDKNDNGEFIVNFEVANSKLEKERKESLKYLQNALGI